MFKMSGYPSIMLNDERVLVRREDDTLGHDTIIVDGKRVKRGFKDFAVGCNVQPVTGDDVIQENAGDRFNEQMFAYVADLENPMEPNDYIYRPDDGWYQVQSCEGWGSYTRARMQRIETGPLKSTIDGPDPRNIPVDLKLLLGANIG